ncbi:MAG: ribbon-helix-helix domain-containing protein [Candidatus Competibacteraceae bacterium]
MSMVRWSVVVPESTDRALRSFLARRGMRKGDLSKFITEAVQAHLLELTVQEVKDRNQVYSQDEILAVIEEAMQAG